jgi:hypothetical protein
MEAVILSGGIDFTDLISENVEIADFKKSKDGVSCTIVVCKKRQQWMLEKEGDWTSKEMKKEAIEFVEEIKRRHDELEAPSKLKESATIEKNVVNSVDPEMNKEIDEITKDAGPMKSQDPKVRVINKGFVRAAVVKRINAFKEDCGYGILTGEMEDAGDNSMALKMTDGSWYNEHHIELITDVNKNIMRIVSEEQHRIQLDANNFCDAIQAFMGKVIYDEA